MGTAHAPRFSLTRRFPWWQLSKARPESVCPQFRRLMVKKPAPFSAAMDHSRKLPLTCLDDRIHENCPRNHMS